MRIAVFYVNSTGYVKGSNPPEFRKDHIKPIPKCGSDGFIILDGRWSLSRCVTHVREVVSKRGYTFESVVGFTIEEGKNLLQTNVVREYESLRGE